MALELLFRQAALDARRTSALGAIILIRPLSFSLLTSAFALMAATVLAILLFGSYTQRSTIAGHLVPDSGMLTVYAAQPGIVIAKHVREGQLLQRGQLMYVLSSERQNSSRLNVQESISAQVDARRQSLQDEIVKTQQLQHDERNALQKRIDALQAEVSKINSQIEGQRQRSKLTEEALQRSEQLLALNFISKEQLQQKKLDLLDQRNRMEVLEREHISVSRDLAAARDDLTSLPLRQHNAMAHMERSLASTNQELTESEARRSLSVTSPEDGIASNVAAEMGQTADVTKPLVSIIPKASALQANLYAPSGAIGFIQPGDAVLIRYQAFPFQQFGHAKGTVLSISKTAIASNELPATLSNMERGTNNEPLYRIVVGIAAQSMNAYGKAQALQAGMLLEADVLLKTRRLYEWVLEPLYSLSGKI